MGAWIETAVAGVVSGVKSVAPYVGAWIETDPNKGIKTQYKSHPTWVRGLKLLSICYEISNLRSHPTWVRGLKPNGVRKSCFSSRSHPTWVRGLKQKSDVK